MAWLLCWLSGEFIEGSSCWWQHDLAELYFHLSVSWHLCNLWCCDGWLVPDKSPAMLWDESNADGYGWFRKNGTRCILGADDGLWWRAAWPMGRYTVCSNAGEYSALVDGWRWHCDLYAATGYGFGDFPFNEEVQARRTWSRQSRRYHGCWIENSRREAIPFAAAADPARVLPAVVKVALSVMWLVLCSMGKPCTMGRLDCSGSVVDGKLRAGIIGTCGGANHGIHRDTA